MAERIYRVKVVSGGFGRIGFLAPVAVELERRYNFNLRLGVSSGALCEAMNSQGSAHGKTLMDLVRAIDTPNALFQPILGITTTPFFKTFGLLTTRPLRKKLNTLFDPERIIKGSIVGFGVTLMPTASYRTGISDLVLDQEMNSVVFGPGSPNRGNKLRDYIVSSCHIAAAMRTIKVDVGTEGRVRAADGGHRHVIPRAPWEAPPGYDSLEIHVVQAFPMVPVPYQDDSDLDGILEANAWRQALDEHRTQMSDIQRFSSHAAKGARVIHWAPDEPIGKAWYCSRKLMHWREEKAILALNNPVVIESST